MNDQHHPSTDTTARFEAVRDEIASGLQFTHNQATANTRKLLEVASFAYAAIDLLAEKGLLQIEELDERQKTIAKRLVEKFIDQGMGLTYQEKEQDKYAFEPVHINCAERVHLCKAACCRRAIAQPANKHGRTRRSRIRSGLNRRVRPRRVRDRKVSPSRA